MSVRHIILISGKDSLATAIVQKEREPRIEYEYVFNETGWDLPETTAWISNVEQYLGAKIIRLGDDLTEICYEQNCLPLPMRRFCTKYAKIKPLNDYLGSDAAFVYFGLRADEPERIGFVAQKNSNLIPVYPLREQGISIDGVWGICESVGLMPPSFYWPWMHARVLELLQGDDFLVSDLKKWERQSLFAWRSRNNCDRCFYARQYEKIGLLEFHPDRFEDACKLEEKLCHRQEFTWAKGYRLRDLAGRAGQIKEARAMAIARFLRTRQQMQLFDGEDMQDDLSVTSCGLLCGK